MDANLKDGRQLKGVAARNLKASSLGPAVNLMGLTGLTSHMPLTPNIFLQSLLPRSIDVSAFCRISQDPELG